jgi:hypothetical protein
LTKGVNPDRKSSVLQDSWVLGVVLKPHPIKTKWLRKRIGAASENFLGDGLVNGNGHEYEKLKYSLGIRMWWRNALDR